MDNNHIITFYEMLFSIFNKYACQFKEQDLTRIIDVVKLSDKWKLTWKWIDKKHTFEVRIYERGYYLDKMIHIPNLFKNTNSSNLHDFLEELNDDGVFYLIECEKVKPIPIKDLIEITRLLDEKQELIKESLKSHILLNNK